MPLTAVHVDCRELKKLTTIVKTKNSDRMGENIFFICCSWEWKTVLGLNKDLPVSVYTEKLFSDLKGKQLPLKLCMKA